MAMTKPEVFRNLIKPLLEVVVSHAKEHDIPFFTVFALDDPSDPDSAGLRGGGFIRGKDGYAPRDLAMAHAVMSATTEEPIPSTHQDTTSDSPKVHTGVIEADSLEDAMAQLHNVLSSIMPSDQVEQAMSQARTQASLVEGTDNVVKVEFPQKRD